MFLNRLKETVKKSLIMSHSLIAPFIPASYRAYTCPGGRIYLNIKESPMMLARCLGLYEVEKTKAISRLLSPGGVFIDVGANKGDFTLLAAKIVGNAGKVFAFEPEPENCHWISKSIQLNGYNNIKLSELALSDTNGEAQLYLGKKSGWHTLLAGQADRNQGTIKISIDTLDNVLEGIGQDRVDMIKIDVEGAEYEVLNGAYQTLIRNHKIILLIDIHPELGVNPLKVCTFLNDLGFSLYQMRYPFNLATHPHHNLREVIAYRDQLPND